MPENGELQGRMQRGVERLIQQANLLSGLAGQTLREHGPTNEVVAALMMAGELSSASSRILAVHGSAIFSNGSAPELSGPTPVLAPAAAPEVVPTNGAAKKPEAEEAAPAEVKPTTFAELLRQRVKGLLPDGEAFSRPQIAEVLGSQPSKKTLDAVGAKARQQKFTRDETESILVTTFSAFPPGPFKPKDAYSRNELRLSFLKSGMNITLIDQWASEIGHKWDEKPKISLQEALSVRGLITLEKRSSAA